MSKSIILRESTGRSWHDVDMEKLDRRILALLARDGRMSYTDIGKETGLSTSAAQQRVRRLEQRGVIKGYTAVLDAGRARPAGDRLRGDQAVRPGAARRRAGPAAAHRGDHLLLLGGRRAELPAQGPGADHGATWRRCWPGSGPTARCPRTPPPCCPSRTRTGRRSERLTACCSSAARLFTPERSWRHRTGGRGRDRSPTSGRTTAPGRTRAAPRRSTCTAGCSLRPSSTPICTRCRRGWSRPVWTCTTRPAGPTCSTGWRRTRSAGRTG